MELNYVIAILDRDRTGRMEKIFRSLNIRFFHTMLGKGTATLEHLRIRGLTQTEKAVICAAADREAARKLFRQAKEKLYIDIPGNGIMVSIPIKSVGGGNTLALMTDQKPGNGEKPAMKFDYEMICVILNEGHSDDVMNAARPAGAAGGTVLSAKGTGLRLAEKFGALSLADEKEVILIVSRSSKKADIMRSVIEKAGPQTKAGAVCFSLPITEIAGLRRLDEEEEEPDPMNPANPVTADTPNAAPDSSQSTDRRSLS